MISRNWCRKCAFLSLEVPRLLPQARFYTIIRGKTNVQDQVSCAERGNMGQKLCLARQAGRHGRGRKKKQQIKAAVQLNYIIKLNPEHGEKLCIKNKILITMCTLQHNKRWIIHNHIWRKSMHHSTWGKHRGFHWYDFSLGTMTKCRSPAGNWSTELCSMCHKSTLQPTGCLSGTNIPSIFQ